MTIDVWNDSTSGNNCYTNWFDGFDVEFANIYLGSGIPENSICSKYFQISDKMMACSFFGKKAGKAFNMKVYKGKLLTKEILQIVDGNDVSLYNCIKK